MRLRRAAKVDANQDEIVRALRHVGAYVVFLSHPVDLLVGFQSRWVAIEVKDVSQPPSKRRLTDDQVDFLRDCSAYRLPAQIVCTVDDALAAIGAVR